MTPEEDILNKLLDRYESSKHLTEPGASKHRVRLKNLKKELPNYNCEKASAKEAYHKAARVLEKEGLLSLEWLENQLILTCIILNLDEVQNVYKRAGRVHPKDRATAVVKLLQKELTGVTTAWIKDWASDVQQKAEKKFKLPRYAKNNIDFLKVLLIALREYDSLKDSITMRAFSSKCYKDTKYFERYIREIFLGIARTYDKRLLSICEEAQIGIKDQLAVLGIYARPELYELAGSCRIETEKGQVDVGATLGFGLAFPSTLVDYMTDIDLSEIHLITFIENKTNYDEYLLHEREEDELVVYHGGFLSPKKQKFFALLGSALQKHGSIRFWADIDLGGFQMFYQMQECIPNLVPMRMEGTFVEQYHQTGLVRSEAYLDKLREVKKKNIYPLFSDAIEKILIYGVTIEQEIYLFH